MSKILSRAEPFTSINIPIFVFMYTVCVCGCVVAYAIENYLSWICLYKGEYASAIETLVTAISLIKQSKVANDDRCKILISSLQDTLHGVETKSYGSARRGEFWLVFCYEFVLQSRCFITQVFMRWNGNVLFAGL